MGEGHFIGDSDEDETDEDESNNLMNRLQNQDGQKG
jgi:hypothetical protein